MYLQNIKMDLLQTQRGDIVLLRVCMSTSSHVFISSSEEISSSKQIKCY